MNHWSVLDLVRMLPGPKPHNPYFDAAKRHHMLVGFRNHHPRVPPTQVEFARLDVWRELQAERSDAQVDDLALWA